MFCSNCGNKIPDGNRFCSACGAEVPVKVTDAGTGTLRTDAADTATMSSGEHGSFDKKIKRKKITTIVIASIAIIVALIGVKALFNGGNSDNAYVYLSDGKYELLTNIEKGKYIEIASGKNDTFNSDLLAFSPDGKYIYYYTKYDSTTDAGSLCRAEYNKLKENSNKNDKYIEVIATNIKLGFYFLEDGSVIYENSDETLCWFNGEEEIKVAKDVLSYYSDGAERIAYTTEEDIEGYALYGVLLTDLDNNVKIASDLNRIVDARNFDNILYTKLEDDESETLYVAGFEKEAEKLVEGVQRTYHAGGKIYCIAENGNTLNLYDFVEDDYAASDAVITEPKKEDFTIPEYTYRMINDRNVSENDFNELYTSCIDELYWYGESSWWSCSMQEALDREWGDNTESVHAATQNFIDKFADSADENGLILVTEEVKAALKEIQKCSDNPEEEWKWMWLCYDKYQSGMTTDYEAYNEAVNKWYEAKNRIGIREVLKNKENDYAVNTLYCFEDGALTTVNENVLEAMTYGNAILFNTTDLIAEKAKIEEVLDIKDVSSLFNIDYGAENHIILPDGTACQMSSDAAETIDEAYNNGYANLYFTNKEVYLEEDNGALSIAAVDEGSVGEFSFITDDAEMLYVDDSALYYASGSYQNNDVTYCDLYSYADGNSTRLARDVILSNINMYDDGKILAYTGYRSASGYELTMIDSKGETSIIGDDITQYIRVDNSTILYISDGDLYVYNGKEKQKVREDVEWIWSRYHMESKYSFGWYDYYYEDNHM